MNKSIATKLKEILASAKWTQEQLARALDVPQKTLNFWINEKSVPRVKNLSLINGLYQDIVGRLEIDAALLAAAQKDALSKHITVKEIITNEDILDKITLHLTYHTNTIEGSTMTLSDVKDVLDDDNKVLANKTAREQLEARNHRTALNYLLDELNSQGKGFKWSQDVILNTHLRLMNTLVSNAGAYRNHGVRIVGSHTALANYMSIPKRIDELVKAMNKATKNLIEQLARTHAVFEQVHPFSDGNGRTGRLIMFIQALQNATAPPLIVKERKQAYYKYLEMAQLENKHDLLQLFLAESILQTNKLIGK